MRGTTMKISRFSALLFVVGWSICDEFCFLIVSVAYRRPLPMDKDGGSPRSTCGVPKGIWSGFILAELSGYSSDSALQEETSEGVSKWDRTSGEHGYS